MCVSHRITHWLLMMIIFPWPASRIAQATSKVGRALICDDKTVVVSLRMRANWGVSDNGYCHSKPLHSLPSSMVLMLMPPTS